MSTINEKAVRGKHLRATAQKLQEKIPTSVSQLTNDSGFQTGAEVTAAINAKVSSTYRAGGSVASAALPELIEANMGLVVNVTDAFTTTADFVEGAGKTYPAGTNVVVVQVGEAYKYDVMAGFVDLSGLQPKEEGKGLSTNDYTTADRTKLGGVAEGATKVEAGDTDGAVKINGTDVQVVEFATDAEVDAMLAEVFGA